MPDITDQIRSESESETFERFNDDLLPDEASVDPEPARLGKAGEKLLVAMDEAESADPLVMIKASVLSDILSRLNQLEGYCRQIDSNIGHANEKLDDIEPAIKRIDDKVHCVPTSLRGFERNLKDLRESVSSIAGNVQRLVTHMSEDTAAQQNEAYRQGREDERFKVGKSDCTKHL